MTALGGVNGGFVGWVEIEQYRSFQLARGLSPLTIDASYRVLVRFAATVPVLAVASKADVEAFCLRGELAPRTRRYYVARLSAFYRWAYEEGLVPANPCRRMARPRPIRGLPRPIPDADLEVAIAAADTRMRLWLCLAAYEGLRCCEIAGLDVEDFLIAQRPQLLLVRKGKGNKARVLPLNQQVREAYEAFQRPLSGALFISLRKGRIQPSTVSGNIGHYLRGLGIEATAHQLRHWFGTTTYRASQDIRMVQDLMGHSSPESTAIYTAFSNEAAALVVQALGAIPAVA